MRYILLLIRVLQIAKHNVFLGILTNLVKEARSTNWKAVTVVPSIPTPKAGDKNKVVTANFVSLLTNLTLPVVPNLSFSVTHRDFNREVSCRLFGNLGNLTTAIRVAVPSNVL